MKKKTKRTLLRAGAATLGAGAGFLFYLKVGCTTGACPLASDPIFPTVWGGLFGWLLFGPAPKQDDEGDGQRGTKNKPLGI